MPTQADYLKYAETAFASYAANLTLGRGANANAYRVLADMAPTEAQRFDATWQVLGQQDLSDGFSATLFQEVDVLGTPVGQKVLAIRGSESSHWGIDFLADVVNIAAFGTTTGFSQYSSLEQFYQSLIANGKLGSLESLVVTGHSLGGFLAQAFTAKHIAVSAAYTYNSPGFSVAGGLVSNVGTQLLKLFGLSGSIPNEKIFNVRALDGVSATSGLGQMIGSVLPVGIEAGGPIHNHSIVTLTDTLSLYEVYAHLDSELSLSDMDAVFRAESNQTNRSLEAGLDDLRRIILGEQAIGANPTQTEDRESFYANIYSLAKSDEFSARTGTIRVISLAGKSAASLTALALGDVGYRYSFNQLTAFAVTGSADLYDRFNNAAQLDLYNPQSGTGLTEQYLADRAAMLFWKIQDYTADSTKVLLGDRPETYKYVDKTLKDSTGNDLTFTVRGRQVGSVGNPAMVTFGSGTSETLNGSDLAVGDHLYGGGGNDVLDGRGGEDYLEGGTGDDRLVGGGGDDDLNGGSGFDTYVYEDGDGFDAITDPGGEGRIVYNGRELSGGAKVADGFYEDPAGIEFMLLDDGAGGQSLLIDGNIYIEDYVDGALGIRFDGDSVPTEQPESAARHFYFHDALPLDYDPRTATGPGEDGVYGLMRNLFGSSADDLFTTAGHADEAIVGRTGNDVAIFDGAAMYDNSIDMGAGDDSIDMSASAGSGAFGQLAGGGGNDYIIGSRGVDRIFGDSYFAISAQSFFGRPAYAGAFFVDDLLFAPTGQFIFGRYQLLPNGGVLTTVGQSIIDSFGGIDPQPDSVLNSDGVLFDGSLEEAIAAVIGPAATFDDYIVAGDGDDKVIGGSGADDIFGGDGDDVLAGDYGDNGAHRFSGAPSYAALQRDFGPLAALFGRPGDDRIDGGEGDDSISDDYGGNDVLIGGEGDDFIQSRETLWTPADGDGAHNVIHGGAGNDQIQVDNNTGGFDVVDGGDGDDEISVWESRFVIDTGQGTEVGTASGRAVVFGGKGNDVLYVDADDAIVDGGAGDDHYTVLGESVTIVDDAGRDTLQLFLVDLPKVDVWLETFPADLAHAPGMNESVERLTTTVARQSGDLVLRTELSIEGPQTLLSELRIQDWFIDSRHRIENIKTGGADRPVLSSAQFEAWGGLHYGSNAADELVESSEYSDRTFGGGGDDLISTGDGADRIFGGTGDDELLGGSGDDIYYYALGDGNDVVEDVSGFDEVRFGPGISAANVAVSLNDSGIVLTLGQGRIEVSAGSRSVPGIERLRFADGTTVTTAALLPPLPVPASGSQDALAPNLPQDDPSAGAGTSNSGGSEDRTDEIQVAPLESPIVAAEPLAAPSAPEIAATAVFPPVASTTAPLPAQAGEVAASPFNDLRLLFRDDIAGLSFGKSESREAEDTRGNNTDAPLDMQTMLDAVQAFDAGSSPGASGGPAQSSSTGPQSERAGPPGASGQELTSWALTNALLQFHLETVDGRDAADGPADFSLGDPALASIGAAFARQGSGLEVFGMRSPALSTFSGLQEGFTRL